MARPKKDAELPAQITRAAEKLDEIGEPELAAAVRKVLPELTRDKRGKRTGKDDTVPIYVRIATWQAALADAARRSLKVGDLAEEGVTELLAGRFIPTRQPAAPRGEKHATSIVMPAERQAEVAAYIDAHPDEIGWKPSTRQAVIAWLEHRYGPSRT